MFPFQRASTDAIGPGRAHETSTGYAGLKRRLSLLHPSTFLWSAPVAFRRVALETPEWTSRDSNHHRQSVSAGKTNATPTEPSGRLLLHPSTSCGWELLGLELRLIVRGYADVDALNGQLETSSPTTTRLSRTSSPTTTRLSRNMLISLSSTLGWKLWTSDSSTAFLQGLPQERVQSSPHPQASTPAHPGSVLKGHLKTAMDTIFVVGARCLSAGRT